MFLWLYPSGRLELGAFGTAPDTALRIRGIVVVLFIYEAMHNSQGTVTVFAKMREFK